MAISDERVSVGDLTRADLNRIAWSGSASHVRSVAAQLDRRDGGAVEYLVVRDASGLPIANAAVDHEESPGAGTIMQLTTRSDRQGQGHARRLLAEAGRRIRARGRNTARLAVKPDDERARRLYEYVDYRSVGRREASWPYEREDGVLDQYRTVLLDMEKRLSAPARDAGGG